MKRDTAISIRFPAKAIAVIRKAANLERRSINQYVVIVAEEAAKVRIEQEKPIPTPSSSPMEGVTA